jgi:putative transposase
MKTTDYPSSITEAEFEQIKPCLNSRRRSKWKMLNIINAIFYLCDGGIKWRSLPHDFGVPWPTVYWYFQKWVQQGVWQAVNDPLVMLQRVAKGANAVPSFAVLDSQSIANAATASEETGLDMGKKTKGRKRLLVVDSQGYLVDVRVVSAAHHDGTIGLQWGWQGGRKLPLLTAVERLYGDTHFGGRFKKVIEEMCGVEVITTHEQIGVTKEGMKLHKKRWVVERTFAWELCSRRLTRDFERKPEHAEAFCFISSINRMFRNPVNIN